MNAQPVRVTGDPGLDRLNGLPHAEAVTELLVCCGSMAWARALAEERPFADRKELLETADRVWIGLGADDWLEAFGAHPRIGERESGRSAAWSEQEQSGVVGAERALLDRLAAGNRAYEERFGHIFLICATGRAAPEMLDALRARLENSPQEELRIAAEEQRKITRLRLEKLLRP